MRYRYLDLRRRVVQDNIMLRSEIAFYTRKFLKENGFLEIETPVLIKSTPEGARDFVVPSRLNPGEFYALPQSPQTFKQLLMVSGYDKYYQIVKCFRDEDFRADRKPEFTQSHSQIACVKTEDIIILRDQLIIKSDKAATIIDEKNQTLYEISKFSYSIKDEILKGEKIFINSKFNQL